jgi:hypothetical protein
MRLLKLGHKRRKTLVLRNEVTENNRVAKKRRQRMVSGCSLAIEVLAMADAKDKNDQAVVFDLADEPVIAYTVFPELSKPRAVLHLSDGARSV